jgi:elongation factor Ts
MVSVDDIKKLRELSGAGIADCREALEATKGDMNKASEYLAKKGVEKAVKKGDRETRNGLVFSYVHGGKIGVVVNILCETDFVTKTEDFQNLGREVALQIASMDPKNVEELLEQANIRDSKVTISDMVKNVIGKLGENIKIGEFARIKI